MSPEDVALMKRQIETQLTEYGDAIAAYEKFMQDWRYRDGGELPAEDFEPRFSALIKAGMA